MRGFACFLFLFVLVLSCIPLGGGHAATVSVPSWRYRVTVSVMTPEGLKSGTAVWEMACHIEGNGPPAAKGMHCAVTKGQAVIVDLGARGLLFGIMQGITGSLDYAHLLPLQVFPLRDTTPVGTTVTLTPLQYPKFIHFKTPTDPRTAENVFQSSDICCSIAADHMEEIFGKGVRIKAVTIEATDAAVTTGIDSLLPWLPGVRGHNLSGNDLCWFSGPPYNCLRAADFERN